MRAQGLRDRGRALEFGAGQEDQELLASDPVGEIECPQLLAELLRDLLEHEVADLASPRLVDLAEVIEVSDDDAYRIAGHPRLRRELAHAQAQSVSGEHARELVDRGVAAVPESYAHERCRERGQAQEHCRGRDRERRIADHGISIHRQGDGQHHDERENP